MSGSILIENRRVALQTERDAAKLPRERNQLGQFATPTALAGEILAYAKATLPPDLPIRFLDPAIGTGAFYSALLRHFSADRIEAAEGYDIDPHYVEPSRELWVDHSLKLKLEDFTRAIPPAHGRFNLLICNPPYVRHHHMQAAEKLRLQEATEAACGVRVAGLTGLYCYFLGLSHVWMAPDGLAGWLIPSEFMDVNYGRPIKQYLLTRVTLLRIHRFDPTELQFGDALVSSAVVWFKNARPPASHEVEFTYGGTLVQPLQRRLVSTGALQSEAKWTRFPVAAVRERFLGPVLADYFKVKRGLATGDNRFFIMTPEQIEKRGLPRKFFKPILPSSRHVPNDEIESDEHGLPKLDHQLFILDCRLPEAEVKRKYPKLWAYYQSGKSDVAKRYLCRYRSPWYIQEDRPAAPFICTYMGRGNATGRRPFRFILNRSRATAANVYLLLYPREQLAAALRDRPALYREIWKFLNRIDPAALLAEGRVYGGGLYKMEPKELANVAAQEIEALWPERLKIVGKQTEMFRVA